MRVFSTRKLPNRRYITPERNGCGEGPRRMSGGMPVFGHEPLDITRKAGEDIKAFVIGEVSPKHQKLLLAGQNSLLHTRLPLAHSLRETGLQNTLQSGDAVYVPLGDKNVMVKCTYQRDRWEDREGTGCVRYPLPWSSFHFFLFQDSGLHQY